jgi:predicted Zn-dependent protease
MWRGLLVAVALLTGAVFGQSGYERARASWDRLVQTGKAPLSTHVASRARVDRIGQRLAVASRRTQIPWHFYVVAKKDVNAFTVGEGFVAVTEGLLALGLDDQELAGVLAHEIAHATEQHPMREVHNDHQLQAAQREIAEAEALEKRFQREYNETGDLAAYNSKLATVKRRLSSAQKRLQYLQGQQRFAVEFSHEQEMEADMIGLRYAVAAGFEPDGLQRALQRIQAQGIEKFGEQYTGEGQTHPSMQRRLELLARVYQSWKAQGWGK